MAMLTPRRIRRDVRFFPPVFGPKARPFSQPRAMPWGTGPPEDVFGPTGQQFVPVTRQSQTYRSSMSMPCLRQTARNSS